jgi:hypothetical protein
MPNDELITSVEALASVQKRDATVGASDGGAGDSGDSNDDHGYFE